MKRHLKPEGEQHGPRRDEQWKLTAHVYFRNLTRFAPGLGARGICNNENKGDHAGGKCETVCSDANNAG